MNKILIVGAPKTGTTALFFNIKNSLPDNTDCLFEPTEFIPGQYNQNKSVLAKILLSAHCNYDSFITFDKKVFICRDPRDTLLSNLLYKIGFHFKENNIDEDGLKSFYSVLKKKENKPPSVAFHELLNHFTGASDSIIKGFERSIEFLLKYTNHFLLKYEDFCTGNIQELENYLEIRLSSNRNVDKEYSRVTRTKSFGNWRDWFTKDDIAYLTPIVDKYMKRFDYDTNDWKLNNNPVILSEHGTIYFNTIVNQRRQMLGMKNILL